MSRVHVEIPGAGGSGSGVVLALVDNKSNKRALALESS